jgi:hypothetical protein
LRRPARLPELAGVRPPGPSAAAPAGPPPRDSDAAPRRRLRPWRGRGRGRGGRDAQAGLLAGLLAGEDGPAPTRAAASEEASGGPSGGQGGRKRTTARLQGLKPKRGRPDPPVGPDLRWEGSRGPEGKPEGEGSGERG